MIDMLMSCDLCGTCMNSVLFALLSPLISSLQCVVTLQPRSPGAALPVHLAAHFRARVTSQHAGHQLFPHPVPHWGAGTLPAAAAGAAY